MPRSLTHFFLAVVVLYHVHNAFRASEVVLPSWKLEPLAYSWGNRSSLTPLLTTPVAYRKLKDPTQKFLTSWGHAARYALGSFGQGGCYDAGEIFGKLRLYGRFGYQLGITGLPERVATRSIPPLERAIQVLTEQGVVVAVLFVPSKSSVEQDWVGTIPDRHVYEKDRDATINAREVYDRLRAVSPEQIPDLLSKFQARHRENAHNFVFMPLDPHWTSFGIGQAAVAAIETLARPLKVKVEPRLRAERVLGGPRREEITNGWLELLPDSLWSQPRLNYEETLYSVSRTELPINRLIVAGSSYSSRLREDHFDLVSVLGRALGRVPVNAALPAANWSGGFEQLEADHFRFVPGDALVWEIPMEWVDADGRTAAEAEATLRKLLPRQIVSRRP